MSLLRQGKAQALTIYLGESDQWQGAPLYIALMQELREHGCAGATATRAVAGYGAGARLHEQGMLSWSSDATIVIQVIDQPERLRRLLPHVREMLQGGLMTLHEVDVLKYTHARRRGLSGKLLVKQVMETSVITVSLDTPIAAVMTILLDAPFRAVPVLDEQRRLQGIISTGDLIRAGVLSVRRGVMRTALELDTRTVEAVEAPLERARQSGRIAQDVMNRQVRSVNGDTTLRDAVQVMVQTGLRRLPVVDKSGVLMGMLTRADVLQVIVTSPLMHAEAASATQPLASSGRSALAQLPAQQRPVAAYSTPDVATVTEQTPFADVLDALILSPLKRVIVLDAQRHVKGIISDVDVLARMREDMRPRFLSLLANWTHARQERAATGQLRPLAGQLTTAADIMNGDVVTVSETTTVQDTIEKMMTTKRKFLPVVNAQGVLTGAVGRSDLLRILLEE